MQEENALVKSLKIRFPIIQAPMANISSPRLVAAVSNSGGLGSLGAAYMSPAEIAEAIREIRSLTEQPFAVNLFTPSETFEDTNQIQKASEHLNKYRKELGISDIRSTAHMPDFSAQVDVICKENVPVFSFTFGIPPLAMLAALKKRTIFLIGTATTPEEAVLLEKNGVDAIVAQGYEAGGHRGTFLDPAKDPCLGTLPLVQQVVQACQIPIIAAGGIMNGAGIAAALALGSAGAQLGTAFIATPESAAPAAYKKALLNAQPLKTTVSSALTGRPARMLKNRFTQEMEENSPPIAPFPYQHFLTKEIRTVAAKQNRPEWMALYAGQGLPLISNLPADEIMSQLVDQTGQTIQSMSQLV